MLHQFHPSLKRLLHHLKQMGHLCSNQIQPGRRQPFARRRNFALESRQLVCAGDGTLRTLWFDVSQAR